MVVRGQQQNQTAKAETRGSTKTRIGRFRFALVKSCSKRMQLQNRECTLMDANSRAFVSIRGFSGTPFWCWLGRFRISSFGFLSEFGPSAFGFRGEHACATVHAHAVDWSLLPSATSLRPQRSHALPHSHQLSGARPILGPVRNQGAPARRHNSSRCGSSSTRYCQAE